VGGFYYLKRSLNIACSD